MNLFVQLYYFSTSDIDTLQKALQLKEQELKHIKRLGKKILDQRTETETFFLTALSQVHALLILFVSRNV